MQEFERLHASLLARSAELLIAFCDVSTETALAARFSVWRTPVVLLFPDTQTLAPALQIPFSGHLHYANLIAFASVALGGAGASSYWQQGLFPSRLQSLADVRKVSAAPRNGTFVGFFRSGESDGPLHRFWPLECLGRHSRAFAVAQGLPSDKAEDLWRWAGLTWEEPGEQLAEEAIVFLPAGAAEPSEAGAVVSQRSKFTTPNSATAGSWRSQVDAFCAWCERQLLAPVTIFDAARAAALDNTFEWLLLLFAPRSNDHTDEDAFPWEKRRLERFTEAVCSKDSRYLELLPVLVPSGSEEVTAFRHDFGLSHQDPSTSMVAKDYGGERAADTLPCSALQERLGGDADDAAAAGGGRRRRVGLWATVLFNTRTRRKYLEPQSAGWTPGDEIALCHFTDAVLDGQLPAHVRSAAATSSGDVASDSALPPGVMELVGTTFGAGVVEPITAGGAEVLLFLYAPWCSHSMNFFPLWHALAAGVAAEASAPAEAGQPLAEDDAGCQRKRPEGHLLLAQMDATTNEHLSLPPVDRFPTVLLGVRANSSRNADNATLGKADPSSSLSPDNGIGINFLSYGGSASLEGLRSWLARNSAYSQLLLRPKSVREPEYDSRLQASREWAAG